MWQKQVYRNIIVDACMHLGDLIHATTVIPLLHELYPEARISFLVNAGLESLLNNIGGVKAVLPYKYKSGGSYLGVYKMAQDLKKYHFDLSISLDPRIRLSAMMWLAGIPTRVGSPSVFGWKPGIERYFFNEYIDFTGYDVRKNPAAMNFQELVKRFAEKKDCNTVYLPKFTAPSLEAISYVKNVMTRIPKKSLKVALCVRKIGAARQWDACNYNQVIKYLIEKYDAYIIGVGVKGDEVLFQQAVKGIPEDRILNLISKTNLVQLNAVFRECDFLINPDNGIGHFAAAAGCPTVTLIPNVDPEKYRPLHPLTQVVASGCECVPRCDSELDSKCNYQCLDMITVEAVKEHIDILFGEISHKAIEGAQC